MVSLIPVARSGAHRKTAPAATAPKNYHRRDIQGLRALAVVAVVLDHLLHWPAGGFVGVDVFFVISGFMITGQLLREHEKTGRISLVDFYRRRVRRLLPASVLVLVCTIVAAGLLYSYPRFVRTSGDAIAALLFAGNWRMATQGTDYFQSAAPPSPLQHFWSLGVEEQFYLLWPALMVGVFLVCRSYTTRRLERTRVAIGGLITIFIAASFWWAMADTSANPSWAYFSTFTRGWELGVGALIAITANLHTRIPEAIRPLLAWIGISGVIASVFVIVPDLPFPGPWAALPVVSSALVILANEGGQQRRLTPLTNPVAVYVGDLSYSIYLWHFPVIIFATVFVHTNNISSQLGILGVIVALAAYSYHLLENPIRRSTWLEPRPRRKSSQASRSQHRRRRRPARVSAKPLFFTRRYQLVATSFLALIAVTSVVTALQLKDSNDVDARSMAAVPSTASSRTSAPEDKQALGQLHEEIALALSARTWPKNLSPTMDEAITGDQAPDDVSLCGKLQSTPAASCTWGSEDAEQTAVIVGDSIAVTYVNVLRQAMIPGNKWRLRSYATFGCTFTEVDLQTIDEDVSKRCPDRKKEAIRAIQDMKPDVVFVANTSETWPGMNPGSMAQSTQDIVRTFRSSTGRVVFLSAPPSDVNIQECFSRISKPRECVSRVTRQWSSVAEADRRLASEVEGTWVDSRSLFCARDACPSFVGRTPVKLDAVHITPEYAKKIAPAMGEILRRQKIIR